MSASDSSVPCETVIETVYQRPCLTLPQQIMVGTLSGWTEILLCQPIDTYKTGLQSANRVGFRQFAAMGLGHWYSGMAPMVVFRAVYISSLKIGNETYKNFATSYGFDVTTRGQLMSAGAVAGVIATPVSCMSEWFKTQMQNNGLSLRSLLANTGSIRRSFTGLSATTIREAGYGATLFGINPIYFSYMREAFPDSNQHLVRFSTHLTFVFLFFFGNALLTRMRVLSCMLSLASRPASPVVCSRSRLTRSRRSRKSPRRDRRACR